MAGWHHWLDGRESQSTLGVGDGQGGLACCDSWGREESDTTERLIWSDLNGINHLITYFVDLLCPSHPLSSFSTKPHNGTCSNSAVVFQHFLTKLQSLCLFLNLSRTRQSLPGLLLLLILIPGPPNSPHSPLPVVSIQKSLAQRCLPWPQLKFANPHLPLLKIHLLLSLQQLAPSKLIYLLAIVHLPGCFFYWCLEQCPDHTIQ